MCLELRRLMSWGASMGGMIAQAVVTQYPHRVETLPPIAAHSSHHVPCGCYFVCCSIRASITIHMHRGGYCHFCRRSLFSRVCKRSFNNPGINDGLRHLGSFLQFFFCTEDVSP
ncbi:hypothetical protein, unlikely [Trypanosoma congolense IL3000]|uniref:Uncharacterized protein n=1 Tax=Trypanosoma congolense (strain IL3000) TaxID=1068625 RepID=F9W6I1_TRYCI|nr:hypothetical protein, unlikely [Trypanosoma congolense IL3000]